MTSNNITINKKIIITISLLYIKYYPEESFGRNASVVQSFYYQTFPFPLHLSFFPIYIYIYCIYILYIYIYIYIYIYYPTYTNNRKTIIGILYIILIQNNFWEQYHQEFLLGLLMTDTHTDCGQTAEFSIYFIIMRFVRYYHVSIYNS